MAPDDGPPDLHMRRSTIEVEVPPLERQGLADTQPDRGAEPEEPLPVWRRFFHCSRTARLMWMPRSASWAEARVVEPAQRATSVRPISLSSSLWRWPWGRVRLVAVCCFEPSTWRLLLRDTDHSLIVARVSGVEQVPQSRV